jgi:hypothetical protein
LETPCGNGAVSMGEANGCAFHARFLAQNLGGLLSA